MIILHRINEKISEKDYSNSIKGIAYKVFKVKDGKLYPPMVNNPGGASTPVGVWLDAEEGEFIEIDGMRRVIQKATKKSADALRARVANLGNLSDEERKSEVKKLRSATLAYRPGWHLGDIPVAPQFDRTATFVEVEPVDDVDGTCTDMDALAKKSIPSNADKVFYVKSEDKYFQIIVDGNVYLPYDFIWAECEYVADIDYQEEAMSYGYNKSGKFQHSLAGLPKVPEGGAYKYRTNPKPNTVPWVITGAIKVTKLLDDYDVQSIAPNAPVRQGGMKTLDELGVGQV